MTQTPQLDALHRRPTHAADLGPCEPEIRAYRQAWRRLRRPPVPPPAPEAPAAPSVAVHRSHGGTWYAYLRVGTVRHKIGCYTTKSAAVAAARARLAEVEAGPSVPGG